MEKITKRQIAKVWATAHELSIDDETLYSIVNRVTGSDKISQLSKQQGIKLIDNLLKCQSENNTEDNHRPGMATKKQLWLIEDLVKKLGWQDDPQRLRGFLKKYTKVENLNWLKQKPASNIIQALKAMLKRQKTESEVRHETSGTN